MRGCRDQDGYLVLSLVIDGRPKQRRLVHRLIALAFHGPPPPGKYETKHANGIRSDNHPKNLSWGNQKENAYDRDQHGHTARGEKNGTAKLSNQQVLDIKRRLNSGVLQKTIAKEFGLHKTAISHIAMGRNWKWL